MVTELMYSTTNTFLIRGANGLLLFDTGWAGTFRKFCREMGEKGIPVQEISYVLISHFHPDHCGIVQEIADCGAMIAVMEPQRNDIHAADRVFLKEGRKDYRPVVDQKVREVALEKSREFLMEMGIEGEVIAMPYLYNLLNFCPFCGDIIFSCFLLLLLFEGGNIILFV